MSGRVGYSLVSREMHEIPPAKPTDAEDVAWGLQTAASLWKRGERSDAVAWLRRAAQAANDAQDDDRALELARLAADLADVVAAQGTTMPGASNPEAAPIVDDSSEESTALDAIPKAALAPRDEVPASSRQPSVPPAEKVHAGMFDPWSDSSAAAAQDPATASAAVAPPPVFVPNIPPAPITQPMFGEEEVVTSAKGQQRPSAAPSKLAPKKPPPPLPPGASRKPPPLPPRALAKPPVPSSAPNPPVAPPVSAAPAPLPDVFVPPHPPAELFAALPPAAPAPPAPEPEQPRFPTPPMASRPLPPVPLPVTPASFSPAKQHDVAAPVQDREPSEDAASSADTTPPPPLDVRQAGDPGADDMAPTPIAPAVAARRSAAEARPALQPDLQPDAPADAEPTPALPPIAASTASRAGEASFMSTLTAELAAEGGPAFPPPPEAAPADPTRAATSGETPTLDLENVDAFSDLPDDARAAFAAAAEVHVLAEGDEVAGFALAYVMEGSFDVAATMVDAAAVRLAEGAVLRARGTTNEGVPMRIISATSRGVIATWSGDAVETAFSNCPWVEDDLRAASDRVMTLVGITIGPLGERLDQSIREEIVGRLTVKPLVPGEIVVNKGEPVPGLLLVGVGEIELVDGDDVKGIVGSGDFLFATEVLSQGAAPFTARAGAGGALAMFGNRSIAQELMVTCPPLLEVFAGM